MAYKAIVYCLFFAWIVFSQIVYAEEIVVSSALSQELLPLKDQESSLQERLDDIIKSQEQSVEFQKSLKQEIEILKERIEYQQTGIHEISVSVDALQNNINQNKTKLIDNKKLEIIGFANTGFRIYSNAPRYGNYLNAPWQDNSSTFSARHILVAPKYFINDRAYLSTKVAWIDGGNIVTVAGSEFDYKVFGNDKLVLRAGLLSPLEINPTTLAPYAYQRSLIDYSLLDTYLVPHFVQDVGVGVKGTLPVGQTPLKIRYEFDILNGFKDTMVSTDYTAGTFLSDSQEFSGLIGAHPKAGNVNLRDNNANKASMSRIVLGLFDHVELGSSYHVGAIDPEGVNNLHIIGIDAKLKYKKIYALFESIHALLEKNPVLSSQGVSFQKFPSRMNGWYGEINYSINPQLTLVVGYGNVNLDARRPGFILTRSALGVSYALDPHFHLKCEYQITEGRDSLQEPTSNAFLSEFVMNF